ncbi:DMT family transporter [Roseivivax isoporae]|uniref:Peptide ABC transporter permease n=1 Tax=Roseivivax isoporae LMG 25204 TaxID=1449351 RepID=X7FB04_9RHOB|nr:DMT family transporter [Roseivivax isoporae]ETX29903.1 peptide ABC transporter permease [Roseivivax isoporae LMG 25204]
MDLKAILMGLAFAAMWSSAFTSARIIVTAAPPLFALSLRFLISGLLAIVIARALGQGFGLTRAQWRATLVFGICQNALYLGLNFVAMQSVEASLAAIIASTMPLMVAFAGWAVLGQRLPALGVAGLAAGVAGVVVIMGARLSGGVDLGGVALCVLGAAALATATLSLRSASSGGNVLMVVGYQMLVGAAALLLPALVLEEPVFEPSWTLFWAFAYTTIVPGVIATLVWFLLVDRIGAVKAATFHFLNPFFGVAIAAAFLGEALGALDVVGVAIIAAGILAVQLSRAQKVPPPAE